MKKFGGAMKAVLEKFLKYTQFLRLKKMLEEACIIAIVKFKNFKDYQRECSRMLKLGSLPTMMCVCVCVYMCKCSWTPYAI